MKYYIFGVLLALCIGPVSLTAAEGTGTPAAAEAQEETRVCPGCGATIPVTAGFCPQCRRYLPDAKIIPSAARPGEPKEPVPLPPRGRLAINGGAAFLFGSSSAVGVTAEVGVRAAPEVIIGGGTGYEDYANGRGIPVYFNIQREYIRRTVSPSVYGNLGFNFAQLKHSFFGHKDTSGAVFGFGGGLTFRRAGGGLGVHVNAGLRGMLSKEYVVYFYPSGVYSPAEERQRTDIFLRLGFGVSL